MTLHMSADLDEEIDEEEEALFLKVAETYLRTKFEACDREEGCRFAIDRNEAVELLKQILPPVTKAELEGEVDSVLSSIQGDKDNIQEIDFIRAILGNSYWKDAGQLV